MKIIVIDNYDSFVYNIVYALKELGAQQVDVIKNDKVELKDLAKYDKIVVSPGPGIPIDAGQVMNILKEYSTTKSIFGVCLGHQAIGEFFKHKLKQLNNPLHGIQGQLQITQEDYLLKDIPNYTKIGHYHSWVIDEKDNSELDVIAYDTNGNIMAIKHKHYDIRGVQFHPESILTENGIQLLANWIKN